MGNSLRTHARAALCAAALPALASLVLAGSARAGYTQTNLVSDGFVSAAHIDPNLKNPWGLTSSPQGSPFWVANQATGVATLYNSGGAPFPAASPLVVTIPQNTTPPNGPTGAAFNTTSSFNLSTDGKSGKGLFFFANLDGSISGWNQSGTATQATKVVTPAAGTAQVYTGLAITSNSDGDFLLAANNAAGKVDVYDSGFNKTILSGDAFVDPNVPSSLHPFNVRNLAGKIYVTYATPGPTADDAPLGSGAVSVFDSNGHLLNSLISGGQLQSPWGVEMAPANFGQFSNALLVGNFSSDNGAINAFNPNTGSFLGTISDQSGHPIRNGDLWSLLVGNGGQGGDPNTLYITAGVGDEQHGVFAAIASSGPQAIPLPPAIATAPLAVGVAWGASRLRRRRDRARMSD